MTPVTPNFDTFETLYSAGKSQIIYHQATISTDTETPITASLKLRAEGEPFFLLESVEQGKKRGRYSIIGMKPDLYYKCDDTHAYLSDDGIHYQKQDGSPIDVFRRLHQECLFDYPKDLPPMASGLVGYMSYDAIRFIETTVPNTNPDTIGIPTGLFMRPTLMVIFDSLTSSLFVLRTVHATKERDAQSAYEQSLKDIEYVTSKLEGSPPATKRTEAKHYDFSSNMSQDEFYQMVERAKEYIIAGDIFQVVPSQRFTSEFDASPFAFYRSLRDLNPSPFLFYLDFCDFQLIGSSPEILVKLDHDVVTIRPLAGTRKRGATAEEDQALSKELLEDEKEVSEHLMLIDLARNDVGRVAKAGSVHVTDQMNIEYYSHVMHISSNVEGIIDPSHDALDALFSAMPVGTVSGAPKVRAMQIIDELESQKRSFYAGCVGYFSANGSMDTCITLRTGLIKDNTLTLQAGGGIVADSVPENEYQESLNKAKALMAAANQVHLFE